MAQNKNLLDLDQKPISYYIITSSEEVIKQLDDSGSIIIRAAHNGQPLGFEKQLNELEGTTYNSIYIGDEHIATGFGFANISSRSYVLDMAYNVVPDLINRLDKLEYGDSPNVESYNDSVFNLNENYKYIKTESNDYELNWDHSTKTLSVISSIKDNISNPCLFSKYYTAQGDEYWIKENDDIKIMSSGADVDFSYLTFEYIGDESLNKIYFDYSIESSTSKTENTLFNYDLCGSRSNSFDITENNDYFSIKQEYVVKDPTLNPETLQEKWRIDFTSKFNNLFREKNIKDNDGIYNLKLNVILGLRKLSIVFITLAFAPPVYYRVGLYNDFVNNNVETAPNIYKIHIIGDHSKYDVTFYHNTSVDAEYEIFYIPTIILDRIISQRGENGPKMTLQSSNITFPWIVDSTINFLLRNNKSVTYYVFRSPNKYKGPSTNWILEI